MRKLETINKVLGSATLFVVICSCTHIELNKPVRGYVSSDFNDLRWFFRYHKGIDFAAPRGTLVRSAASGKVKHTGYSKTYGYFIFLSHLDNYETRYAHLSKIFVKPGDRIWRGRPIGRVGRTGNATGNHLHFELREDDWPVDPDLYWK